MPDARGAQGSIYFATRDDGVPVAIKVAASSKRATEALRREIDLLRALETEGVGGVVRCIDAIEVDGQPAMVMHRYPGHLATWLQGVIANPGPSTLEDSLTKLSQLARTLHGVHAVTVDGTRIVHRDVKPENIFVDERGQVVLGDFGGAMAIDGLQHVELALFGTPMWAPLDQILPGITIPDPTWDTYALCVLLYACFTGARPAYQADPRELLTPEGRELWELARQAILAEGEPRKTLRRDFARQRQQAHARDIVDFTGRAALNEADRSALDDGVAKLAGLAGLPESRTKRMQRAVWTLLVRGLSPLSHPSPPNRFREGEELADALDDLHQILDLSEPTSVPTGSRATAPGPAFDAHPHDDDRGSDEDLFSGPMSGPDVHMDSVPSSELPPNTLSTGPLVPIGAATGAFAVLGLFAWLGWVAWSFLGPAVAMVHIPATETHGAFQVDRTEVTHAAWSRCVASGECTTPSRAQADNLPAVGVPFDDAVAYCAFRGGHLPTEAEWLRVIGDGPWPWGDADPTCAHANAADCGGGLQPPGSAPEGTSAEGVVDLAGNAWEWVVAQDGSGVLVGGGARSPRSQIGAGGRWPVGTGKTPKLAGLRCAYDAE